MKIKTPHIILTSLLASLAIQTSHGAVITFTTFDAHGSGSNYQLDGVNAGSFAVTSSQGDPTTYSFSQTADLDGGTVNDTLTFDFVYTIYTGSTISGGDVILGTSQPLTNPSANSHFGQNYVGDGVDPGTSTNNLEAGDSFKLSIQNIVYTDGEGDGDIANFLGFVDMHKFGGGTDDLLLGTTGYTNLTVGASGLAVDFGGYVAGDLVLTTSIASGSTAQRLRDLQFTFETVPVPEPSSTALLGLGLSSLLLRRKRN